MHIFASGPRFFWISFIVGLSGAVVPGPLFIGVVHQSARRGFAAAPQMVAGHLLAEVLLVGLMAGGLLALLDTRATRLGMAVLGGVALSIFGVLLLAQVRSSDAALHPEIRGPNAFRAVPLALGFLLTVTNPYWFIWWVTIGASSLAVAPQTWGYAVWFLSGHALSDLAWSLLVGFLAARGIRALSATGYRRNSEFGIRNSFLTPRPYLSFVICHLSWFLSPHIFLRTRGITICTGEGKSSVSARGGGRRG